MVGKKKAADESQRTGVARLTRRRVSSSRQRRIAQAGGRRVCRNGTRKLSEWLWSVFYDSRWVERFDRFCLFSVVLLGVVSDVTTCTCCRLCWDLTGLLEDADVIDECRLLVVFCCSATVLFLTASSCKFCVVVAFTSIVPRAHACYVGGWLCCGSHQMQLRYE